MARMTCIKDSDRSFSSRTLAPSGSQRPEGVGMGRENELSKLERDPVCLVCLKGIHQCGVNGQGG